MVCIQTAQAYWSYLRSMATPADREMFRRLCSGFVDAVHGSGLVSSASSSSRTRFSNATVQSYGSPVCLPLRSHGGCARGCRSRR